VFTARYALSPYIKQICFVFKALITAVLPSLGFAQNRGINTYKFLNAAKNSKYPSKYRGNFCPTIGYTVVISVRYQLPRLIPGLSTSLYIGVRFLRTGKIFQRFLHKKKSWGTLFGWRLSRSARRKVFVYPPDMRHGGAVKSPTPPSIEARFSGRPARSLVNTMTDLPGSWTQN
jgi:hypothetical protein